VHAPGNAMRGGMRVIMEKYKRSKIDWIVLVAALCRKYTGFQQSQPQLIR